MTDYEAERVAFKNRFEVRHNAYRVDALTKRMGEAFTSATPEARTEILGTAERIYQGLVVMEDARDVGEGWPSTLTDGRFVEHLFDDAAYLVALVHLPAMTAGQYR